MFNTREYRARRGFLQTRERSRLYYTSLRFRFGAVASDPSGAVRGFSYDLGYISRVNET